MRSTEEELVRRAIQLETEAVHQLVGLLRPTIQARVVRALMRAAGVRTRHRSMQQEVEDLCQEVFLALFDDDAKALRAWQPARAPLGAFVSILAEHEVLSILRSGRRRPWRDEEDGGIEVDAFGTHATGAQATGPEAIVGSLELLDALLDRLREELSPTGLTLFYALIVDEQPVEEIQQTTGMSREAIYAWRSRLLKLVRKLASELESLPPSAPRASAADGTIQRSAR